MKKAIIGGIAAAAVALGIAGAVPAQAHADAATQDATFVAGVRAGGVTGSVPVLIANGHAVCYNIDVVGQTPAQAQHNVSLQTDMDENHSIWFTIAAIDTYCPWNTKLMPGQTDATGSTAGTTSGTSTAAPSLSATVPGTDSQGWLAYHAARCDPGNPAAAVARTTKSVLVVCQTGPGNYYYRGLRLSDSASIELANAVRSSQGFDVTNPVDGTRYQIRPTDISITSPGDQVSSEPMIQYAAS